MNCSVCYEHHNVSTSFFSVFPAGAGVIHIHILFSDEEWIAEEISTEIVYLWDDKKGTVPNGISYGFQEEEST